MKALVELHGARFLQVQLQQTLGKSFGESQFSPTPNGNHNQQNATVGCAQPASLHPHPSHRGSPLGRRDLLPHPHFRLPIPPLQPLLLSRSGPQIAGKELLALQPWRRSTLLALSRLRRPPRPQNLCLRRRRGQRLEALDVRPRRQNHPQGLLERPVGHSGLSRG